MTPDFPHTIRMRLAELNFFLFLHDVAKSLPCWLSQFRKAKLRQPTGQRILIEKPDNQNNSKKCFPALLILNIFVWKFQGFDQLEAMAEILTKKVRFLGDLKTPKCLSEINWPLVIAREPDFLFKHTATYWWEWCTIFNQFFLPFFFCSVNNIGLHWISMEFYPKDRSHQYGG